MSYALRWTNSCQKAAVLDKIKILDPCLELPPQCLLLDPGQSGVLHICQGLVAQEETRELWSVTTYKFLQLIQ